MLKSQIKLEIAPSFCKNVCGLVYEYGVHKNWYMPQSIEAGTKLMLFTKGGCFSFITLRHTCIPYEETLKYVTIEFFMCFSEFTLMCISTVECQNIGEIFTDVVLVWELSL